MSNERLIVSGMHISRSWDLHDPFANDEENPCGCGTAPCGAVDTEKINPECKQHNGMETLRKNHAAETCPMLTQDDAELERQNDAYMERGQPGGRA